MLFILETLTLDTRVCGSAPSNPKRELSSFFSCTSGIFRLVTFFTQLLNLMEYFLTAGPLPLCTTSTNATFEQTLPESQLMSQIFCILTMLDFGGRATCSNSGSRLSAVLLYCFHSLISICSSFLTPAHLWKILTFEDIEIVPMSLQRRKKKLGAGLKPRKTETKMKCPTRPTKYMPRRTLRGLLPIWVESS